MKKILISFTSFLIASTVLATSQVVDKTLAVVNGEPILSSEFNSLFAPIYEQYEKATPKSSQTIQKENELKDLVLNQKIDDLLLKQQAKNQNIKVSKKEIQDGLTEIKKRFSSDAEFKSELKKENMTIADFEKKLNDQIAIMKLVKQNVEPKVKPPTDTEAKALYNKIDVKMNGGKTNLSTEDNFLVETLATALKRMSGEQLRLRQIFINCAKGASQAEVKVALEKVATVKKELQKKTFSDVAAEYSEDPVSKARNGDLGLVAKDDLPSNISKIVFSMKVGDYTKEPIKTDTGYHFVKVEEKRAKRDINFDDVKGDILELLYQSNARVAYNEYINSLKSKANIKINKTW
ncbi:MAG: SurA N-terminal domain-containing protein [Endomicrobium sp.]|jgi:parvulin-like peptidyl-prolyl isomerase|uniref:peptidylprolyl isomerase n=1 Tax=Candidatus Endomicrobiellum cubanum TaxID=3242325 RepID=UPI00282281A5|nr:SurA N-terminal domain-containing protein [Endomicrobium sp.]